MKPFNTILMMSGQLGGGKILSTASFHKLEVQYIVAMDQTGIIKSYSQCMDGHRCAADSR